MNAEVKRAGLKRRRAVACDVTDVAMLCRQFIWVSSREWHLRVRPDLEHLAARKDWERVVRDIRAFAVPHKEYHETGDREPELFVYVGGTALDIERHFNLPSDAADQCDMVLDALVDGEAATHGTLLARTGLSDAALTRALNTLSTRLERVAWRYDYTRREFRWAPVKKFRQNEKRFWRLREEQD